MGKWSREELQSAFDALMSALEGALATGDFEPWCNCLTDDAIYSERGAGIGWDRRAHGRAAIRTWKVGFHATFPQQHIRFQPVAWVIVDEARGWMVCEWRSRMADPGSSEVFEWRAYARLFYAGQGRWSFIEEIYNSTSARVVMGQWLAARKRAETKGIGLPTRNSTWGESMPDRDLDADGRWSKQEIRAAVEHFDAVFHGRCGLP